MKGQITDIIIPVILVFMFTMIGIIGAEIMVKIRDGTNFTGVAGTTITDGINFYNGLDTGIILLFIGLLVLNTLLAFLINTHPVYLGLQIIAMIFLFVLPIVLMDVFDQFKANDAVSDGVLLFPKSIFLMSHLGEAYLGTAVLWFASFYIKARGFSGNALF